MRRTRATVELRPTSLAMCADGCEVKERRVAETRLVAIDGAVNFPIRCRANRTVIAVLVHSEQRILQPDGALFHLAHRPKLRNRVACPSDDDSLAALYSGNEAREVSFRIGDIDSFAAHMSSLASRDGLIKLAGVPFLSE